MKIIKDELKQINLHPLVIYFILYSKDYNEIATALKQLNRYQGFTRGLFKFQVIKRADKHSNAVSKELTDAIMRCNMFVRLVDDNSDSFNYAVHNVNFNRSANDVEYSIHTFIVNVCKQNIKQLESRAIEYAQQGVSMEKLMEVQLMQQSFQSAINLKGYKHGVWENLMNENTLEIKPLASITRQEMPKAFKEKFDKAVRDNNPLYLWSWFESYMNAPTKEESDLIAKGYYNTKYSSSLKRDIFRRTRPEEKPVISVEIKQTVTKVLKDGLKKKEYGFIFMVNGETFPICFGSRDQTMLYACTLLRKRIGEKMYLHEFYNNHKGKSTRFKRNKSANWLNAVFNCLFPYKQRDFDEWKMNVEAKKARPLNQGKSQIARQLEELFETQPNAIYFSIVNTREDDLGDSFYDVMIAPERIIIPDEMQFLINEFEDLMGI